VLIAKAAVVHKDGGDFVFVIKGNRVEQRVIRLGQETGDSYFVLEGLSGGESTAVLESTNCHDGDRVKVQ